MFLITLQNCRRQPLRVDPFRSFLLLIALGCYPPSVLKLLESFENIALVDPSVVLVIGTLVGPFDQREILLFLFLNYCLHLSVVFGEKARLRKVYLILRSFCLTCQLRFLKIDFCRYSSTASLSPSVFTLLLFRCTSIGFC